MTKPTAIMIFAAGKGTRMQPLTNTQPKPLIKVAGKAMIDHAFDLTADIKTNRMVVNIHAFPQMVKTHVANRDVQLSDETAELLDTGGGLRKALPLLGDGPVFTLNTDAVWIGPNPLADLASAWDPARMDALLHLVRPENALGHKGKGDFLVASDGQLTRGPGPIYTGAQIIKTEGLLDIPDTAFSLNVLWDKLQAKNRLFGLVTETQWCDVGHPAAIPLAEEMLGHPHEA